MVSANLLRIALTPVLMYTTVCPQISPPGCLAAIGLKKYQDKLIVFPFKLASSTGGLHWPKNCDPGRHTGLKEVVDDHSWCLQSPRVPKVRCPAKNIFAYIPGIPQ